MKRVRVSTTVDGDRLSRCRRLLEGPDSVILDRALQALIDELEGEREVAAILAQPYDDDPEVAWTVSEGPTLPYDGKVPAEVLAKARERRRRS